ncbi:MAG TPA: fumarylacetoacetate hydrolase family protein [Burkholderiaceae bacterium]|nr:fumarylacetoacetate hydrolase family protein [Burkholderiaceae bacterium]
MSVSVLDAGALRLAWKHDPDEGLRVGTVYGVLLNYRGAIEALGAAVHEPPYKGPPRAPVLYIKPRNTHRPDGAVVRVPDEAPELEIGAVLGLVIGRTACRVAPADALSYLAGYTALLDVSVPHAVFYRPSIRFRARDGFCPIGPAITACGPGLDPDDMTIRLFIDGTLCQQTSTSQLVRPVPQLLAEVTDFMTLSPGDILMVGIPVAAPQARAGQSVAVEIDGVGRLQARLAAADRFEGAAA